MSTLTVKVCEECGEQAINPDRWLAVPSIDIRLSKTNRNLLNWSAPMDFCSPGCLLRRISRELGPSMNGHRKSVGLRQEEEPEPEEHAEAA